MKKYFCYGLLLAALMFQSPSLRAGWSNDQEGNNFFDTDTKELPQVVIPFVEEEGGEPEFVGIPLERLAVFPADPQEGPSSDEAEDHLDYAALVQMSQAKAPVNSEWTTGEEVGLIVGALTAGAVLCYGPRCYESSLNRRDWNQESERRRSDSRQGIEMERLDNGGEETQGLESFRENKEFNDAKKSQGLPQTRQIGSNRFSYDPSSSRQVPLPSQQLSFCEALWQDGSELLSIFRPQGCPNRDQVIFDQSDGVELEDEDGELHALRNSSEAYLEKMGSPATQDERAYLLRQDDGYVELKKLGYQSLIRLPDFWLWKNSGKGISSQR